MTTGEWIVVGIFAGALICSLCLFLWLRRLVRGGRDQPPSSAGNAHDDRDGCQAPD